MPQRALWNGFLKLSLVSCPIALYPATAADKRLSFRQVNRQTGNRLRHQLVDVGTGEVVQSEDRGRGYEVEPDQFLMVADQELEAAMAEARTRPFAAPASSERANQATLEGPPPRASPAVDDEGPRSRVREVDRPSTGPKAETSRLEPAIGASAPAPPALVNNRTISLDRFVPEEEIDRRYIDSPYYLVPRDEIGEEAFSVIRDAIQAKAMVGMGRVVLQKRERPIIVTPMDRGLAGFTLRFAHEVRDAAEYFASIPTIDLPQDMVEMAELLIERKSGSFDPAFLEDRYRTVLVEKLRQRSSTRLPKAEKSAPASSQNVIDLMAALKRSIRSEGLSTETKKSAPVRAARVAAKRSRPARRSGNG